MASFDDAKAAVSSADIHAALVTCIERELALLLMGEDVRDISRLSDVTYNGSQTRFALARGHAFPVPGRGGLSVSGGRRPDRDSRSPRP